MTVGDDADAGAPRQTKLYGAIDLPEHYPPTLDTSAGTPRRTKL